MPAQFKSHRDLQNKDKADTTLGTELAGESGQGDQAAKEHSRQENEVSARAEVGMGWEAEGGSFQGPDAK